MSLGVEALGVQGGSVPRPGPRPRPAFLDDELQPTALEFIVIVLFDGVLHVASGCELHHTVIINFIMNMLNLNTIIICQE